MLSLPFLALIALAVGGSALMTAAFMWLALRRPRGVESGGSEERREMAARQQEVERQVEVMQKELDRLSERVDFTEKLLEGPRE